MGQQRNHKQSPVSSLHPQWPSSLCCFVLRSRGCNGGGAPAAQPAHNHQQCAAGGIHWLLPLTAQPPPEVGGGGGWGEGQLLAPTVASSTGDPPYCHASLTQPSVLLPASHLRQTVSGLAPDVSAFWTSPPGKSHFPRCTKSPTRIPARAEGSTMAA